MGRDELAKGDEERYLERNRSRNDREAMKQSVSYTAAQGGVLM